MTTSFVNKPITELLNTKEHFNQGFLGYRETGGRNTQHASRGSLRDLINYVDYPALWLQCPLTGSEFKVS